MVDRRQRRDGVGHVVRSVVLRNCQSADCGLIQCAEIAQTHIAQPAWTDLRLRGCVMRSRPSRAVSALERMSRCTSEFAYDKAARRTQRIDVDRLHQPCQVGELGRREGQRNQRRIACCVGEESADHSNQRRREHKLRALGVIARRAEHRIAKTALRGVPAIDGIAVVRGEKGEIGGGVRVFDFGRRRKATQQRWHRRGGDADEPERLRCGSDVKHACCRSGRVFTGER